MWPDGVYFRKYMVRGNLYIGDYRSKTDAELPVYTKYFILKQWHLMIGLEGETIGQWHLMIGLEGETTGQ